MAERVEELWVDTNDGLVNAGQYVEGSEVLLPGVAYTMLVDGNWNIFYEDGRAYAGSGDPSNTVAAPKHAVHPIGGMPAIMYPTDADRRGDACLDAEARMGWTDPPYTGHHTTTDDAGVGGGGSVGKFLIDLDRTGYFHPEPIGGPFSAPQPGHLYRYELIGAGHTVRAGIFDSFPANSGRFRIRLYYRTGGWKIGSL